MILCGCKADEGGGKLEGKLKASGEASLFVSPE